MFRTHAESTEPKEDGSDEDEVYDDGYGAYSDWKPEGADDFFPGGLENSTDSTEPNEDGSYELKPGSNETYDDGYGAYGDWKPEGADDFFPGGFEESTESTKPTLKAPKSAQGIAEHTVHTAVIPTSTNVSLKNSTDASKIEENDGVENINNAEHSDPSRKGLTTEGQEAENDKNGKRTQSKEVGSPLPFSPKRRSKAFTEYKWLKMAEKNENNSDQTEEETEKDFNSENEFHDFTSDRSEEDFLVSLLGQ